MCENVMTRSSLSQMKLIRIIPAAPGKSWEKPAKLKPLFKFKILTSGKLEMALKMTSDNLK